MQIWKSANIFTWGHSKSTFIVQGGGGFLKSELKPTGGGGGQVYRYIFSLKKIVCFKQQLELFLISCLAVAKYFLF